MYITLGKSLKKISFKTKNKHYLCVPLINNHHKNFSVLSFATQV